MRFQTIELYGLVETGRDELGNPIKEPAVIGEYQGRLTTWSIEEIALLDREITRTQQKLLTDAPESVIKQTEMIKIGDTNYTVIDVKFDFIRWRLCHVKAFYQ